MELYTYVNYAGKCEKAFQFYEQHLGGEILMLMRHGEKPDGDSGSPELKQAVLHARIRIGGTLLMGADIPHAEPMRSAYLSLLTPTASDADRIYGLLSDGGEVFMPMQETFFAKRFAMLRDRFGASWMILHERPNTAE